MPGEPGSLDTLEQMREIASAVQRVGIRNAQTGAEREDQIQSVGQATFGFILDSLLVTNTVLL